MKEVGLVFLGSGIGGALRYGVGLLFAWLWPAACFPFSTLTVNVLGSFLIGILFAMPYCAGIFFLGLVGFCGGFTTFSALSGEGVSMLRAGQVGLFASYVVFSVVLGVAAAWFGFSLIKN